MFKKGIYLALIAFTAWCATTAQGKLVAIRIAAAVGAVPPVVEIDPDQFDAESNKQKILANHSKIKLQCIPERSDMGDEACHADVSILNNLPAYNLAFFFKHNQLNAVRMAYQSEAQEALENQLSQRFQLIYSVKNRIDGARPDQPIEVFKTKQGALMTSKQQSKLDELVVLWVPRLGQM